MINSRNIAEILWRYHGNIKMNHKNIMVTCHSYIIVILCVSYEFIDLTKEVNLQV